MAVRVFLAILLVCPVFAQSQPPAAQEPNADKAPKADEAAVKDKPAAEADTKN